MSVNKSKIQEKPTLAKDQGNEKFESDGQEKGSDEVGEEKKTKFYKICTKCGINPNLFFLKMSLFVMYGGK